MGAEVSNVLMVCIGLGTVFFGLVCLVLLCYIMSAVCGMFAKSEPENRVQTQSVSAALPVANKQEIIAASCAVIAEELGEDANNIKVVSFKRI